MVGPSGQTCLEHCVSDILPTSSKTGDIDVALAKLREIIETKLYKFCSINAQGSVTNTINMVDAIRSGRPPTLLKNPTDFMVAVKDNLQFFCLLVSGDETLTGAPACTESLRLASIKDTANVKMDDLALCTKFSFLLNAAQTKQFGELKVYAKATEQKTMATACLKMLGAKRPSEAASSSSAAASSSKGKKAKSEAAIEASEVASALAMFTGKFA